MTRHVIIGSGVAGISAAETIRKQDPHADLLMVGEETAGYYSRPGLGYYLSDEIPEDSLYPLGPSELRRLNLRLLNARVGCIRIQEQQIELESGERHPYDRLLLATGSSAAMPGIPGIDLQGVVKLDTLEDARGIIRDARRGRRAVVVGGGITALEIVEGLRARGVTTHYFLRGERYWRNVLTAYESRLIEHRLREEGVILHHHTSVAKIVGKRGRVSAVITQDGKHIPCHLVAVAIGVRPNIGLAEKSGLATERGVLVDEFLQTSEPGIFAAGDVAQVYDPFTGKSIVDSLWGPAREQGRTAGLNMTGRKVMYRKEVAFNVTRLAGLTTTIIGKLGRGDDEDMIGIAHGDSETWRELPDAIMAQSNFDVNHLRIVINQTSILGALIMGNQTLSRPLQQLISAHADISPVRDALLQPEAPIADLIADFYTSWVSDGAHKPA